MPSTLFGRETASLPPMQKPAPVVILKLATNAHDPTLRGPRLLPCEYLAGDFREAARQHLYGNGPIRGQGWDRHFTADTRGVSHSAAITKFSRE